MGNSNRCRLTTALFVGMIVFIIVFWVAGAHSQAANQTGIVTASTLNVRVGAGVDNAILQQDGKNVTLSNGFRVTITETLTGWYKVSFNLNGVSLSGYVSADYIAIETAATSSPQSTQTPVVKPQVIYRTETSYKPISVAARISKTAPLCKKNGKTRYKVAKKKIYLAKKKKITIQGEKIISGKKWFKISFTYKKKKRTAYVRNTYVKMTLKKAANAKIFNVKKDRKSVV